MSDSENELSKIRSPILKADAGSRKLKRHVVLVQLKSSSEGVVGLTKSDSGYMRPQKIVPESSATSGVQRVRDIAGDIEEITGRPTLTTLFASEALVIDASGRDLRAIAKLPEVEAIYLNEIAR